MNINFGLFPAPEGKVHKKERKAALTSRARADLACWISDQGISSDMPALQPA
jgi:methylenetetrahydrofolate--tRNA-(uracil-5-)-methyltransferase